MLDEQVKYYEEYKQLRQSPELNTRRIAELESYLVMANIRLAYIIARRYKNLKNISSTEIKAHGMVAILHAIRNYDETKGAFVSYVCLYLRSSDGFQSLDRFEAGGAINLPHNAVTNYFKERREKAKLDEVELSEESMAIENVIYNSKSLSEVTEDGVCFDVAQSTFQHPDAHVNHLQVKHRLQVAIDSLVQVERDVINYTMGLSTPDTKELSLREVGILLNISHERVRQLKIKAQEKLRHRLKVSVFADLID